MFAEESAKDRVERGEITRIMQPNATADHVFRAISCLIEDGDQILNGLARLDGNAARDQFPIDHGHLAGDVQPTIRFHRPRERKMLTSRALAACNAVSLETQC